MTPAPNPAPVQAFAPDLARRVALIVANLAALVAHRFLREPRLSSLIIPLWTRLTHTARRFERLMAQITANRAQKPRPTRPPAQTPTPPERRPAPHRPRLAHPRPAAGSRRLRCPTGIASRRARVADLLAASPAATRILRPLGRMLGLTAFAPKRNAPKRNTPKPRPQPAPRAAPRRAPLPPLHSDPSYRPSANWPRAPWPAARPRRAVPA